ncbi:MAG: GNAT family N-acetyltransferase, partial [Chloroflexi bacterium]|nr:GNAT family N-acetyltransferase [Chloroflexota bacterium]
MGYSVRAIADSELVDWVSAMHTAFHSSSSADEVARFRVDARQQDVYRTLASFDDQGRVVGTYESFTAQLTLPGVEACLPANAVTSVSVLPTHHRRGLLRRMIGEDLQAAKERGEAASILIAAEYPIYGRFGFGPSTEQVEYRLQTAHAKFVAQASGSVELVSAERMREVAPTVFDAVRRTCPGQIDRHAIRWDVRLGLRPAPWRGEHETLRCAIYTPSSGEAPTGYVLYRVKADWRNHVPGGRAEVEELMALDGDAYLGLWRYCAELDLVSEVTAELRRVYEPLPWLLADARKAVQELSRSDFLWLRPLDTARLLETRRYATADRVVIEVDDPLGLSGGRFALEGGPDGAQCRDTTESADLRLGVSVLG